MTASSLRRRVGAVTATVGGVALLTATLTGAAFADPETPDRGEHVRILCTAPGGELPTPPEPSLPPSIELERFPAHPGSDHTIHLGPGALGELPEDVECVRIGPGGERTIIERPDGARPARPAFPR
ncbi:hypothetical protein [Nocardia caishijiensis]|uniref:Secreted protein n=1 Tax=Nocardia caishijiensis TaxID=184756 RepID=A0ABQ6YJX8_9NOCA|nr:hypothetical protein [Nocardia caishijiensis]KAF0845831.1 hypothetical protein FNL39_106220 [Nocardia caishijiensis]